MSSWFRVYFDSTDIITNSFTSSWPTDGSCRQIGKYVNSQSVIDNGTEGNSNSTKTLFMDFTQ